MTRQSTFQKLSTGWQLGKIAFRFVEHHKKTLLFTFVSGIFYTLTGISFLALILGNNILRLAFSSHATSYFSWFLCFMFFFISISMSVFMQVALSFYTAQLLEERPASIRASLNRSLERLDVILGWGLFDATVGTVISALRSKKRSLAASILSFFLGAAITLSWKIISFFVIPLIALQQDGLIDTIKLSTDTMKKTWGQSLGAHFNVSLIGTLFIIFWYALFFGTLFAILNYTQPHPLSGRTVLFSGILGITAFIIPIFIVMLVTSTIMTILKTALFHYSQNKPTGPFSTHLLKNSFVTTIE